MLAHGFSIELLVKLVHAGLATASAERMIAGRHPIEVTRVRITEAGRRALAVAPGSDVGSTADKCPLSGGKPDIEQTSSDDRV